MIQQRVIPLNICCPIQADDYELRKKMAKNGKINVTVPFPCFSLFSQGYICCYQYSKKFGQLSRISVEELKSDSKLWKRFFSLLENLLLFFNENIPETANIILTKPSMKKGNKKCTRTASPNRVYKVAGWVEIRT